jgi:hypothetical protein
MESQGILIESVYAFARHTRGRRLDDSGFQELERIFNVTIGARLGTHPGQWQDPDLGRNYVLIVIARIGEEAAKIAGALHSRHITGEILNRAADYVFRRERHLFLPDDDSPLCDGFFAGG